MTRKQHWTRRDPNYKSENNRYRHPVPSRRFLIETLEEIGRPCGFDELARNLGISESQEREALEKRLRAMVRDGQLIRNRRDEFCLTNHIPVVSGRVTGHRDGFGFLIPDDGSEDVYLSPRQMREIMHGDRVAVRVRGRDRRGRREGSLVEVLERKTEEVVGRYVSESGLGFVAPDNRRIVHDVAIAPGKNLRAKPGQIVVAKITEYPSHVTQAIGEIVRILGDEHAAGMETDIAIHAHELPHEWPAVVKKEIGKFGDRVPNSAKYDRYDLRDTPLVTIDGADARDFDDAVYCEPSGDGWLLLVAIADVSHYVKPRTALDDEAQNRGTSVYFPNRVVPMLPEKLSNGLCSLNPGVDRLCVVCEMHVSKTGILGEAEFYEAVMRSAARLTYREVEGILVRKDPRLRKKREEILPDLENLFDMYKALVGSRNKRGAIDFDLPEVKMQFGSDGRVANIVPYERGQSNRLIEECMIAANIQAARFLAKHRMPALYRVHQGAAEDRLESLREFLAALGLKLGGGLTPKPTDFSRLLKKVAARPDAELIEMVMLRSMTQAVYQPQNIGHFGLALSEYAHFTSPIRRYPDLLVHRAIRHIVRGGEKRSYHYSESDTEKLGILCSAYERRADDATRDALDWLKTEFMQDKIGEEFDGMISGVTDFGLFVRLKDLQIEGLVHVSALSSDYYQHDAVHHRLYGERNGMEYRLTDPIRIRVIRASLEDKKIDFEPVGGPKRKSKPKSTSKTDHKKKTQKGKPRNRTRKRRR